MNFFCIEGGERNNRYLMIKSEDIKWVIDKIKNIYIELRFLGVFHLFIFLFVLNIFGFCEPLM